MSTAGDPPSTLGSTTTPGARGQPDPDSRARSYLANERTFLAWIRTAISMMAIGVAAAQFIGRDMIYDVHVVTILSLLFVAGAVLITGMSLVQFKQSTARIRQGDYESQSFPVMLTTAICLLAGGLAVIVVFTLRSAS